MLAGRLLQLGLLSFRRWLLLGLLLWLLLRLLLWLVLRLQLKHLLSLRFWLFWLQLLVVVVLGQA